MLRDADSLQVFAELLRSHRTSARLTQTELAERASMSARGISDLERGTRRLPQRETVQLLTAALELSPVEALAFQLAARRALPTYWSGSPRTDTSPPTTNPGRQLPRQLTSFIGRDREVTEVQQLLRRSPLLTLTGPAGIGKTRLAQELASVITAEYDRVTFVALAAVRDAVRVLPTVGRALGVADFGDQSLSDRLCQTLMIGKQLLILDNCEQIVEAGAELAALLVPCPNMRLLVTSRRPLRVTAEQEYPVPPLEAPCLERLPPLPVLAQQDAIRLFVDRARSLHPHFSLDERSGASVAAICARLEGVPLAIELAAARVRVLPPVALLSRLDHCLDLLKTGGRDMPERHRSMRAALDWSYNLLPSGSQALFRHLSVFVGGWDLPAAETTIPVGADENSILERMDSLLEHSLVQPERDTDAEPRFRMLDVVREYALELLTAQRDDATTCQRHAAYFLAFAEAAGDPMVTVLGGRQGEPSPVVVLEREHDNLHAAFRWFVEQGDLERAMRLAWALWPLWYNRGIGAEAMGQLETLLAAPLCTLPPDLRANGLRVAAQMANRRDDRAAAQRWYGEQLTLARQTGNRPQIGDAMSNLGLVARGEGRLTQAQAFFQESLEVWRTSGDKQHVAMQIERLGTVDYLRGDFEQAEVRYAEALAICRRLDRPYRTAYILHNVGALALARNDSTRARPLLTESLRIWREQRRDLESIKSLALWACLAAREGRATHAYRLARITVFLAESHGLRLYPIERFTLDRCVPMAHLALAHRDSLEVEFRCAPTLQQAIGLALEEAAGVA